MVLQSHLSVRLLHIVGCGFAFKAKDVVWVDCGWAIFFLANLLVVRAALFVVFLLFPRHGERFEMM
jgi:hypothetical protein